MLSGGTFSACAMVGTAVFRIVVSSDSMKNATATSHGNTALLASAGNRGFGAAGKVSAGGKAKSLQIFVSARMSCPATMVNGRTIERGNRSVALKSRPLS